MLKLWNKYKVIAKGGHDFKIGSTVVVFSLIDGDDEYRAGNIEGTDWYYIGEDDVEPLDEPSVI